jgi:hypothetical protein
MGFLFTGSPVDADIYAEPISAMGRNEILQS